MSKICENCGNMIPDGTDVCPNCGREDYNDDAMKAVLSELSLALNELQGGEAEQTSEAAREPEQASPENVDDTILFNAGSIKDAAKATEQPKDKQTVQPEKGSPQKRSSGGETAKKKSTQGEKKTAQSTKQGGTSRTSANSAAKKSSAGTKNTNTKRKKRKKKKKGTSNAAIGIVIGLIVALLLIFAGALFMLYQMGFFVQMSDDKLLQNNTTVSAAPVETVAPSSEPASVEEKPVVPEEPSVLEPEISAEEAPEVSEEVECTKFKVTGAEYLTLYSRGETSQVVYVISPEEARANIEWESSDETIATVSDIGVIAARRGGTCTITGTCGDKSITIYVTCDFTVPSTVLDMNYDDITMDYEGQTAQLYIDYDLTDEQIAATVWESSDESVATVDDEGLVTAIADGTAVISASIGSYTASCIVRCVKVTGNKGVNSDASEFVINYEDVTLTRKGEYFQLTLKSILGNDVPAFTWKSSDTSVATVDSKGVVTAVANGTANITTTVNGDDFRCIVRVNISG